MASSENVPSSHAISLLNGLLKQITTLGVASIGFLFAAHGAGFIRTSGGRFFGVALGAFIICVVLAVLGQIAIVSQALEEQWRLPAFLGRGRFWFILSWAAFAIGVAVFAVLVL